MLGSLHSHILKILEQNHSGFTGLNTFCRIAHSSFTWSHCVVVQTKPKSGATWILLELGFP